MKDNSIRVWCLLSTYIGMTCQLSCCAVQLQIRGLHCPIIIQIGLVIMSRVQVFCDSLIMLWRVHFGEINVFNSGLVICGLFNLWRNPWLFFHSSVCLRRIFSLFFFFFFKKIIQVKAKRQKMTMPFMRVIITFVLLGRNKLLRSSQTS